MRARAAGIPTISTGPAGKRTRLGIQIAVLFALMAASVQPGLGAGGLAAIDAYNIGRYHYASAEYAKAVVAFNDALQRNPKFGVVYLARGRAYYQLGKQNEAVADCTMALKFHPHFAEALVARGDAYQALGQFDEAVADFQLAIKLEPRNAVTFQHRARAYQAQGLADLADADFKTALTIDPLMSNLPPLVAASAKLPAVAPPTPSAVDAASHGVPTSGGSQGSVTLPLDRAPSPGQDLAAASNVNEPGAQELSTARRNAAGQVNAPAASAQVSAAPPLAPPAGHNAAIASQVMPALPQLPRIQEGPSDEASAAAARECFERGRQLSAQQKWSEARGAYTQALDLDPQLTAAYGERGRAALKCGQFKQAVADYDILLERSPGIAQGYCDRGRAHAALRHWPQSLADFDAAVRLVPGDASVYLSRAEVQASIGHADLAEVDRKIAARLNGKSIATGNRATGDTAMGQAPGNQTVAKQSGAAGTPSTDATTTSTVQQATEALQHIDKPEPKPAADVAKTAEPQLPALAEGGARPLAASPPAALPTAKSSKPLDSVVASIQSIEPIDSVGGAKPAKPLTAVQPTSDHTASHEANMRAAAAAPQAAMLLSQPLGIDNRAGLEAVPVAIAAQTPPVLIASTATAPAKAHIMPLAGDAAREPSRTSLIQPVVTAGQATGIAVVGDTQAGVVLPASASIPIEGEVPARDNQTRLADLNQELQEFPGDAERYIQRAQIQAGAGRWEDALADASAALRLAESNPQAFLLRAGIYSRLGRLDAAERDYDRAIELAPGMSQIYSDRAAMWCARGAWQPAIDDYTVALRLDPRSAEAHSQRGFAWLRLGERGQAAADFSAALELAPKYCPAMLGRGQLSRLQGDYRAALTELDRALKIDPTFAPLYLERSLCHAAMGREDNARTDRAKAAELMADSAPGR